VKIGTYLAYTPERVNDMPMLAYALITVFLCIALVATKHNKTAACRVDHESGKRLFQPLWLKLVWRG
jgi:hypothetical protein